MKKRYEELDSIRGIAALIVLVGHFLVIYPVYSHAFLHSTLGYGLSFLWNGHGSVIVFFVLSGFVLSLPFQDSFDQTKYGKYLIKRVCRIYIPYVSVISFAIGARYFIKFFSANQSTNLVQWAQWKQNISHQTIFEHYLFLGEFNFNSIDMVIWSLVHEMRISLIFPIVLFFLFKMRWQVNVGIGFLFSILSYVLIKCIPTTFNDPLSTNYFITFHYLFMFIVGALLARYKDGLIKWMVNFKFKYLLFIVALFVFNFPSFILSFYVKVFGNPDFNLYSLMSDWLITVGAFIIILFAISSKMMSKILLIKSVNFLGKISYSLYLTHPIILIIFAHVLNGKVTLFVLWTISFIVTISFSTLLYNYIELPSIKFGRSISERASLMWTKKIIVSASDRINS